MFSSRLKSATAARIFISCLTLHVIAWLPPLHGQIDGYEPQGATIILDTLMVEGNGENSSAYDPTGLDGHQSELADPPFSNELLSDAAFDEVPLTELGQELESLAASRVNTAEIAAGSESISLRGFPAPLRRDGFSQTDIPEVLNAEGSELVIGSLVPVIGRAAPGGIRNIQTGRPNGRTSHQLEMSGGTNGAWKTTGRASGTITPKKSWYLASAGISGTDGPQKFAHSVESSARVALAFRHSQATSTLWSVDVLDYQGNPAPGIPEYRLTPSGPILGTYLPLAKFHAYGPRAQVGRQATSLGFQLESQLEPDLTLSSATQFFGRRSEQDRFTNGQYIVSTGVFSGVREPYHREESFLGLTHQTDLTRRFQALGADHKLQGGLEVTLARDADNNRGLLAADRNTFLPADVRTFDPDSPDYYRPDFSPLLYRRIITDRENTYAHAGAVTSLRSAFNHGATVLTSGVRRDFSHIEVNDHRIAASIPHAEQTLANTSGHVGVNQRVGHQILLFATASSAVQPSTRVDARTGQIQKNASTTGIECGARTSLIQRTLTFGLMGFAYKNSGIVRRNPLYQDPVADANQTQPQLVTSGEEVFRGLTTQAGWKPDPSWTCTTRATWTDAYTVSSPDLPEEEGLALTQLPRFSAAAGVRYGFRGGPLTGLSVGGAATHIGGVVQNYSRPGRQRLDYGAYTVTTINTAYTWRAGKITHTVSVGVGNLFDTDLLAKVARVGAGRSLTLGWRVAF
jgi:iron complex outermembrane recepter protein